ncbi:MAG: hypothetical protein B6229_09465 [Spirochaetaceae bacterium 4572_7]|nr:MAG: hypothetical protein B6229_09465 [Spirochaetaceae bacterium 4572_7]
MIKNVQLIKRDYTTLQKELVRKTIHMTIAFVPLFAGINNLGIFFYLGNEYLRSQGIVFVSALATVYNNATLFRYIFLFRQ